MSGSPPGAAVVSNGTAPPSQAPAGSRLSTIILKAGIVVVGLVAVVLGFYFYFARQRKANEAARLEREWVEQRRQAAERRAQEALESHWRVASIPIETVVPVFILQPDGRLILAAHKAMCASAQNQAGEDGSQDGSEPKPPVPRTPTLHRNEAFGWRRQADCPSTDAEQPGSSGGGDERPPPPL